MIRSLLIRFLSWLLKKEPKLGGKTEETSEGVKFISPFSEKEAFDKSENITDFINKLPTK
jgi:hypothetical protein